MTDKVETVAKAIYESLHTEDPTAPEWLDLVLARRKSYRAAAKAAITEMRTPNVAMIRGYKHGAHNAVGRWSIDGYHRLIDTALAGEDLP